MIFSELYDAYYNAVAKILHTAVDHPLSNTELSLTLTDHYFRSIEACNTISEITRIMQSDFVQRVHRCQTEKMSKPVRTCCDYISLHPEEEITLSDPAEQTGYADYYIS